jgi:hypothetical protein
MKKMMLASLMCFAFVCGTQAYQVTCNFALPHDGVGQETTKSVTTDFVEYKVVLSGGETLADFYVGAGVAPIALSMYLATSSKGVDIGGWTLGTAGTQQSDTYTPDGTISSASDGMIASLHWDNLTLAAGTYYFGYAIANGSYSLIDTGWDCDGTGEVWADAVSSGTGPVHTVPEPTSFALIGLGAAVMALRRRKIQA